MNIGWIKLHRKVMDSKYYFIHEKRPATVCEAWIDLLLLANYESKNWRSLPCRRGELLYSQEWYADRWRWNKSKVRRWLESLKKDGAINKTNAKITVRIKITNYDTYQANQNESIADTQPTPTKEAKSNNQEKISEEMAEPDQRKFGNPEVNEMLEAMLSKIGIDDFADTVKWKRIYAGHCLNLLGKIGHEEFTRRLDSIINDPFRHNRCNEIKYIYQQIKGFIEPKIKSNIGHL